MRAGVLYRDESRIRIEERDRRPLARNEVRVRIHACGVCGSDVHFTVHKQVRLKKECAVLGHEASGVILEIGEEVRERQPGERVVISAGTSCGVCPACSRGHWNLCASASVLGLEIDGAFAEEIIIEERYLIPLPSGIPFDHGAILADAVSTPYHALKYVGFLQRGEKVGIIGIGGLGVHAVQIANILGANQLIAVDIDPGALENASRLGADECIDAKQSKNIGKDLKELSGGLDILVDFSGQYKNIENSLRAMNFGGRMVLVGLGKNSLEFKFPMMIVERQIRISGSLGCDTRAIPELMDLYLSGKLDLSQSITSHHPLEEVNECLENLHHRKGNPIRYIITPNGAIR
ncbi:MAG: alcohol dehydrogenase catalytic domain-containing protein [Leptospiraceae bacterium]|nr:zinc-binding dehydrogenase [Leptospiraceae bacterium]MCP5513397.1 alcohol dehydrogenase catalytic domain-containing protein [Leptospiraceae bacterium]